MAKPKRAPRGGMNNKGRSTGGIWHWRLTRSMATSAAFRSLGGAAVKVLCELRTQYNGGNNGDIACSRGELSKKLGMSKSTAHAALKELVTKGFIRPASRGDWYGRQAATWTVTDAPGKSGDPPTNDWRRWSPGRQIQRQIRTPMGRVPEADIEAERRARNSDRGTVTEP